MRITENKDEKGKKMNNEEMVERINVLQKTLIEMGLQWKQEGQAANDCIVEILNSYMEFIAIVQMNCEKCNVPEQFKRQMNVLCKRRQKDWSPILEEARAAQKEKTDGK